MDKDDYYTEAILDYKRHIGQPKAQLRKFLDSSLLTIKLSKMTFAELESVEIHAFSILIQFYKYVKKDFNPVQSWRANVHAPSAEDQHSFWLSEYFYKKILKFMVNKAKSNKLFASIPAFDKLSNDIKNVISNKLLMKLKSRIKTRIKFFKETDLKPNPRTAVKNRGKNLATYYEKLVKAIIY